MNRIRLDQALVAAGLATNRSQAANYIKLGYVKVNGKIENKSGGLASMADKIELLTDEKYVSRAALKLKSVSPKLKLDFKGKIVLDVGSSTGGFTDYALQHGAKRVIAVDVGTKQLHSNLRDDPRIELHEQTDIRNIGQLTQSPNLVLIDVSFISLREVLPTVAKLSNSSTEIVAMVKPQFEAGEGLKNKGVIKNEKMRREVLQQIERWVQKLFIVVEKADSLVLGEKGNRERFYKLKLL